MLVFLLLGVAQATTVTMSYGFYTDDQCTTMVPSDSELGSACEVLKCDRDENGESVNVCDEYTDDNYYSYFQYTTECTCVDKDCGFEVTNVHENVGDQTVTCMNTLGMHLRDMEDSEGRRRVIEALRRRTEEESVDDLCVEYEDNFYMGMKFDGCSEVDHEGLAEVVQSVFGSGKGELKYQPTDPDAKTTTLTLHWFEGMGSGSGMGEDSVEEECTIEDGQEVITFGEGCNNIGVMNGDVFVGMGKSFKIDDACDGDTVTFASFDCSDCDCELDDDEEAETYKRGECAEDMIATWTACVEPTTDGNSDGGSSAAAFSTLTAITVALYNLL